jgi:uncharacterized membrane protein
MKNIKFVAIVLILINSISLVSAHGWVDDWDGFWMMWWNWYMNWDGFAYFSNYWYIGIFVHLLLFWLVIYWIYFLIKKISNNWDKKSSITILEERYAKWEIDKKEFDKIKATLIN